jgi:glutathione S-transferase
VTDLTLYTNPQSRGRTVHWMIEEVGEPYETVWIDFDASHKPDYLAVNPMGKVPALRHGDVIVTEAAAICTYLADAFPDKGLAPPLGDRSRGTFYRWLFFAAGPLEQATTARALGWAVPDGRSRMVGFGSLDLTLDTLERTLESTLASGPFLCGQAFTAADLYLGSHLNWGMMFGTIGKRPAFERYVAPLRERPAFRRSIAANEARLGTSR